MAEIFLARLGGAAGFEKLVCIKRILPDLVEDPQFVAMFLVEARIAARISHPNVCQVFELGEVDNQYYIAMEYLEGVPLSCFRRPELYPMPPELRLVIGIAAQACEGLHHAHQLTGPGGSALGVVHRDISPQNLFVTADGIVKVLDFGIAKIQDASTKTTTGSVKGTYAYMAPEQLKGERVDRRADVFALGAVVWETLARRHLFRRETDFLTFQAITTDPVPDVCVFRPDVPPQVGEVLARALSRDREQRYPTARALGEALVEASLPSGGPLGAAAIGEEVLHAFSDQVHEQRALLAVARDGGDLDLETTTGPGLGLGASVEIQTTPISSLKRRSDLLRVPTAPPSAMMSVVEAPRSSKEYRVPTVPTMPVARPASRLGLVIALILIAAGGGAGGVYYFLVYKPQQRPKEQPLPIPIAMAVIDAGPVEVRTPSDVGIVTPDAAIIASADAWVATVPGDAGDEAPADAQVVAVKPQPRPAQPPKPPKLPPKPPSPSGPPGTITIDSAPVYAVIFIDGKRYGETPLPNIKLAPGKHTVRAVSPSGAIRTISIQIEAGKKAPGRRIEW